MKYVLIREDDVSYFTPTSMLDDLYSEFLDNGIPINVSVIPLVRSDTALSESNIYRMREGLSYEPFIPPSYRGADEAYVVGDNRELVSWVENASVEIVQHGLCHNGEDIWSTDSRFSDLTVKKGRQILKEAFGYEPDFFVPPWDFLPLKNLTVLMDDYLGVSLEKIGFKGLALRSKIAVFKKRLFKQSFILLGEFIVFEHPGYLLSRFNEPEQMRKMVVAALEQSNILVLVNHHWEFYYDWRNKPYKPMWDAWNEIVNYLLSSNDVLITTFSQLRSTLLTHKRIVPK